MIVNKNSIYSFRLVSDILLLNISFILSAIIAQSFQILIERNYMFILLLILNIVWFINSNLSGFYSDFFTRSFSNQFFNILKSAALQVGLTILFIFLIKEGLFTRNFIVLYGFLLTFLISIRTIIFKKVLKSLRKKGKNIRTIILIGADEIAKDFKETLTSNPDLGYNCVGFLDDKNTGKEVLGTLSDLDSIIKTHIIDEAVIVLSSVNHNMLDELIRVCNINAVKVHIIPDYFRFLSERFQVSTIGKFPIITARDEPLEEANRRFVKRTFDVFFSLIVIVLLLSWLLPLIIILIKLSSKGSVFYLQDRIGSKNQKFKCYKFRTMKIQLDDSSFKPVVDGDERVTKVGRFLRRSNIDELPQFFNVLKGDMSVVGPRPHAIPYQDHYGKVFEEIKLRHNVRPGITGWAQVNGLRGDIEDEELNRIRTIQRMKYDLWYIENWSMKLDMQIIFMTVWQMIKGDTKAV